MKKLQILIIGLVLLFGVSISAKADTTQTITQAGNYQITVRGADGGSGGVADGGSGATVSATFALLVGDKLTLVTGIHGDGGGGSDPGGGGGGTAVILTRGGTKTLLIVAGAGGGSSSFGGDGGGGNSAQGTASASGDGSGGGSGGNGGGGGGFNANGDLNADTGEGIADGAGNDDTGGGAQGTLSGGGGGGFAYGGGSGGYGFGGGGGGSSYVAASGTNITRTDGEYGGSSGQNGSIIVAPVIATAATVSVSGRVTTANGRGIMNVRLTLTDSSGQIRTATTTSFGYYRFDDVQAGETYILSASGKHYTFSQPVQAVNINEETNQVNFIADSEKRTRVFNRDFNNFNRVSINRNKKPRV